MPVNTSARKNFREFFASRFFLRENALWRVMKLLGPVKHWVIVANILLAVASSLTAVGFVSLVPLAQATLSRSEGKSLFAPPTPKADSVEETADVRQRLLNQVKDTHWAQAGKQWVERQKADLERMVQESLPKFVALYALFLLGIVLIQGALQFLGNLLLARATIQVSSSLMRDLYKNVLQQEMGFFHTTSSGYLLNICYREVFQLREIMNFLASDRIMLPVQMCILFVALLVISPQLSLLLILLMPVVILPMMLLNRKVKQKLDREIEEEAQTMEIMSEGFHNIQAVKAFGAEQAEQNYMEPSIEQYVKITRRRRAAEAITGPIVDVLNMIVILVVFVAAIFVFSRSMDLQASKLIVFMVALQRFYRPFRSIMSMKIKMQRSSAVANRIFGLLDRKSRIHDSEDSVEFPARWSRLIFKNVSLSYEVARRRKKSIQRLALSNVNMDIRRGEAVAVVGPNGAGKSSIVNLVCRLYDPSSGQITIDGLPLNKIKLSSLHEAVCLITQHPILFNRTVTENIAYGLENVPQERIIEAARATGAAGFIQKLSNGYDTLIGEQGRNLSGGERQKIVLARAFVRQPQILILDEPTTGLDHETTQEFLELVSNLRDSRGMTIIYITHERSHLARFDRILRLTENKDVVEETLEAWA